MSRATTPFFQPRSFAASTCGAPKRDAVLGHRLRFLDDPRRVQQRLGRNAADVQADAAERRAALDQRDRQPEIGGAERRGVAAGTGAEHDQVEIVAVPLGRLAAATGSRLRPARHCRQGRPLARAPSAAAGTVSR